MRSIIVHGHFYQPPREDPWLEAIERERSAAPAHDWNERIERECYRAVVAARLLDAHGRIRAITNTLEAISFNFGPTLLEWMEHAAPATYAALLEGDRRSAARLGGHGNAIAQPYHHTILPLASRRDKRTEVRWGIRDFRRRYGRTPEGMWLPETAVDDETLDVLAEEGIRFTILAPHQVVAVPPRGLPGRYRTSGGRTIALCVYDGGISHDIAFGGLLRDAHVWAERMLAARDDAEDATPASLLPDVVAVATDGETYGHHHKFGEMALASMLELVAQRDDVRVENFAAFLARHPAAHEVELAAPSSWSCAHGVERWRANCGCRIAGDVNPDQSWRTPLRAGLEELAHGLHELFEREGSAYFADPWAARDAGYRDWGRAADSAVPSTPVPDETPAAPRPPLPVRALELLEMERDALRMFTSCAWFFDDIGGLEPLQVLRYAAHAIELAGGAEGARLEAALLDRLAEAVSNDPTVGTARDVYLQRARPSASPYARVAAGEAAVHVVAPGAEAGVRCCDISHRGARVTLVQRATGRTREYEAVVERESPAHIAVRVRECVDDAWLHFDLAALPERAREVVARTLRHETVAEYLTPDELERVRVGDLGFVDALARALVRALRALGRERTPMVARRVLGLVELLELEGAHVPFDAQTEFHRARTAGALDGVPELAAVAHRLGFAYTA